MNEYKIAGVSQSPADYRDYQYVSPFTAEQIAEDKKLDLRGKVDLIRIEQQGSIGSCVGNGVTSTMEQFTDVELSRMFLYNATKAYEGRLGQEGLYTRNAYKVARSSGVCTEYDYPYDLDLDNIKPPEEIYALADYKIDRFECVVVSKSPLNRDWRVHNIKSALKEGFLVGFAMAVTNSLYELTGPETTHKYDITAPNIGGHYMYIVGYDDEYRSFIIANSWGTSWGDGGFAYLPYSIVNEPFFEAYIIRSVNGLGYEEPSGIKMEYINKFRMHARIVPKADEIGKVVKIWVGGVDPEGNIYMKQPVHNRDQFLGNVTDFSGGVDQWQPLQGDPAPVIDDYEIREDNPLRIISWRDLRPAAGARIYVAYGTGSVFEATPVEICTIPDNL